jgi:hypothetical protein
MVRTASPRWENNIEIDPLDTGQEGVDWIHLTWDRNQRWAVVNSVNNLLCRTSGSHSGGYEKYHLVGYNAV